MHKMTMERDAEVTALHCQLDQLEGQRDEEAGTLRALRARVAQLEQQLLAAAAGAGQGACSGGGAAKACGGGGAAVGGAVQDSLGDAVEDGMADATPGPGAGAGAS